MPPGAAHMRRDKAAAMVERNGTDYAAYLNGVFPDDPDFRRAADNWAVEEVQHGDALGRWAMLADPAWDYPAAFARYREGFKIDVAADASIRGSRTGELIARCMVEIGTSSYYTALGDATEEPVLKASDNLTKPKEGVAQITISSASRDRCVAQIEAAARYSSAKSRADTASSELRIGWVKPSSFAVALRSMGNGVPASAAAPSGDSFARACAPAKRPRSRDNISTYARQ